ncbi:MAG: hypothetical protein A2X77_05410 [Gammaproteobacteria bacterium GWE2_42_36]|nr:MAG: hypothetical protein A2X77_05410 [Gammaproteobacteria bacterium GWE2_42_36]HCU05121.1 hypothetical protein [Coxiellaceae bacterium]
MSAIRRYLLSGLLFWLPILVTFWVLRFLANLMDGILKLLPNQYRPDYLLGFHIPGLGIIVTVVLLFFTGMIVANFIGRKLVKLWDGIVLRIPVVRSIYSGVQQVMQTILSPEGKAFRKVILVEYPRKGLWSIAFQTGDGSPEVNAKASASDMITIFIPTTPNPTSGFLMMVSKQDIHELEMTVDQAFKLVVSLGVVQPDMAAKLIEKK